jgi:hypothetical protein
VVQALNESSRQEPEATRQSCGLFIRIIFLSSDVRAPMGAPHRLFSGRFFCVFCGQNSADFAQPVAPPPYSSQT